MEKEEGFLKLRRFKIDAGERFLIIEDVITKGGRVKETIDIVHNFEGKVNGVGVLVDRSNQNIDFNAPLVSLLNISPNVYDPKNLPEWLAKIPLSQPGSK